jgi:outer membrane lipoprotein carrier protein
LKKKFSSSALALFYLLAGMPSRGVEAQNTIDLNSLISRVEAKYSRMKGLAADFVQIYRGQDGRTRRETGSLLLKRPGKARWNYTSPERKVFISDGKNIFFYVFGEAHATKAAIKESVDPQIPFLFLLGRRNVRNEFSRIEMVAGESPSQAGNVVLRLVPKRAADDFKQLLAEISPSTYSVVRLVIFERGGSVMNFLLSNVRENFVAADSEFKFTPPPGVTIRQAR